MDPQRRLLLTTGLLAGASLAASCTTLRLSTCTTEQAVNDTSKPPPGKPGEFDFLAGEWRIKHRRLKADGSWDLFDGEATCFSILKGVGSIEELRIPARDFSGTGIRLLDVENKVWNDHWVNAKSGVLTAPGQSGGFIDGVGWFISDDVENGKPVKYAGIWDEITPTSCRWRQASSRDGGKTWDENWVMNWTRA
jgi:hypothetical protein